MTNADRTARSILIIDGNSWTHRAFHAISTPLTAPNGQPTNAVFGFMTILLKTLHELKPDAVVAAFDAGRPAFRTEALTQYKMQRPPMDPRLKEQFPLIENLLKAMNVPVVKLKGWEGDDILGTLSAQSEAKGYRTYLASGDKDIFQLVTGTTSVVSTKKGMSDLVVITPAEVEERYGIRPDQVIDYLGLKGDSSDNIPGVPSVGEKTATKLLCEYQTLEGVLDAAREGKITGKVGSSLVENTDLAHASKRVATIMRDVPVSLELDDIVFGSWNTKTMTDAFMELRMRNPLARLLQCGPTGACELEIDEDEALKESLPASVYEKSPYRGLVIYQRAESLFDNDTYCCLAPAQASESDAVDEAKGDEALAFGARALETETVAVFDIKDVFELLYPRDTTLPALVDRSKLESARLFDISIAAYLLNSDREKPSLEALSQEYLGVAFKPSSDDAHVAAREEAVCLTQLAAVLQAELKKDNSLALFETIEMPLALVLADVERQGVAIDEKYLAEMGAQGRAHLEQLQSEIHALAGHEFNIDSPKQVSAVLFEELGLKGGKKTKTGYSTSAAVLEKLRDEHPIVEKILEFREYGKLQSTYIEQLPTMRAGDGRIHTTFNQTVAATGRLSSKNPNLQNIPVRTQRGREIRKAFIPRVEGWKLLSVDYSQIELRILAHLSGDEGLIEAFCSGADFHTATAARIFGVKPDEVDSAMRSRAKAVNFGIVYGQGAHGLGESLDISYGEAQEIIDRYYLAYPRVKEYLNELVAFAKAHGWVETAYHRKRHVPNITSANFNQRAFGERTAMNHPMQGTAADLIKLAMIAVSKRLQDEHLQATMLLQVHDELVFEAPDNELETLSKMVSDAMTSVATLRVPLLVSCASGPTWAEAK